MLSLIWTKIGYLTLSHYVYQAGFGEYFPFLIGRPPSFALQGFWEVAERI